MANSHTVYGVVGFLISPIGIRLKTVWAGKLRYMQKLHSNFKSQLHRDSIHSMTGVCRPCHWFEVRLMVRRMRQWWKTMVLRHWNLQWRVWWMLSRPKTNNINKMRRTGSYRSQCLGWQAGSQNQHLPMENNLFGKEGNCKLYWSRVDRERVSKTEDSWGEIHLADCFRSINGS